MSSPKTVGDLRPAEYNPRKISPEALKMLARSLAEFGDLSGIIFNRKTGNMIGGHQRAKALDPKWEIVIEDQAAGHFDGDKEGGRSLATGYVKTPFGRLVYREVSWSEQKEKAANIAANKHGGDWDIPKLKELLVELNDGSMDLSITGFDEKELQALIDFGAEAPLPDLDSSDGSGFMQMTFILSEEQAQLVAAAIDAALQAGPFDATGNENKNGNALHRICATYQGGKIE
jgi:hypothetical protein